MSEGIAKSQKPGTSHFRLEHQLEVALPSLAVSHIQIQVTRHRYLNNRVLQNRTP